MAAYFENLRSIFRTGGGSGKELESALANGSAVTRVEWRTLPLPGFYGTLGSKHSLLVFSTESGKRYVVEKYRDQTMRKGVFVSEWGEVAPKAPALRLRCNDYDGGDEEWAAFPDKTRIKLEGFLPQPATEKGPAPALHCVLGGWHPGRCGGGGAVGR